MVYNTNQYIPEVYRKERDMQVFTKLLDILLTCCKYDIDSLYKLYDAQLCPENLLPYLADTVNYKYDSSYPIMANREIIKMFMLMLRYKGSEKGIKMATALSLTSLDISVKSLETADVSTDYINALSHLDVHYDYETATIIIDYPNVYTMVRYLIDYVRPVGMFIDLRSVAKSTMASTMAILAQVQTNVQEYLPKQSYVNTAKVNFSYPTDNHFQDMLEALWTESEENFHTIDLNG